MYKIVAGKPAGKRPLWNLRCRWEDNIKVNLKSIGCEGMDLTPSIHLAQDKTL
jgi:hypothetical protein